MGALPGNEERNARILSLRRSGKMPREICEQMGLGKNIVVGVINRAGMSVPGLSVLHVPKGEDCYSAKLTEDDVRCIRGRVSGGIKRGDVAGLAAEFGVAHKTIWQVINRATWKHIA